MNALKLLFAAAALPAIVSCGGDSSSSNDESILIQLAGESESTLTVDNSADYDKTDLLVTGNLMTITVASDLSLLDVSGSNNAITVKEGVNIDKCEVDGDDNSLTLPDTLTIFCEDTGSGNSGF